MAMKTPRKDYFYMKIVIVKSPRFLSPILKRIFKIRRNNYTGA